jgi:hypothetical protein
VAHFANPGLLGGRGDFRERVAAAVADGAIAVRSVLEYLGAV